MPINKDGAGERTFVGKRKKMFPWQQDQAAPAAGNVPVTTGQAGNKTGSFPSSIAKPMPLGHLNPPVSTLLGAQNTTGKSGNKATFPWLDPTTPSGQVIEQAKARNGKATTPAPAPAQTAAAQNQQTQAQATQPAAAAADAGTLGLSKSKKGRGKRGRVNTLLSSAGGPAETFG